MMMHRKNWMLGTLAVLAWAIAVPAARADFFVTDADSGTVSRVTASGSVSTFATGLSAPTYLAFGPTGLTSAPEPSSLALLGLGAAVLVGAALRRRA